MKKFLIYFLLISVLNFPVVAQQTQPVSIPADEAITQASAGHFFQRYLPNWSNNSIWVKEQNCSKVTVP